MKKNKLILTALVILGILSSCSKTEDTSKGSFSIAGTSYSASASTKTSNALSATSASSGIAFLFTAYPTTSGTYVLGGTGTNGVSVTAYNSGTKSYVSKSTSTNVAVTVSSGKITGITLPEIWGYNLLSTGDSVKISASGIKE